MEQNVNDIIVGLDIGTTKIACFIGRRNENGKIAILGYGKAPSKGVERGVVKNIKSTSESIVKAVEEASEKAGVTVREVYVGIAGQHIKSTQSMGSIIIPQDHKIILQEDVDRLIEDQRNIALGPGEEIIHIFPQNYVVDGEELSSDVEPVGVAGKQLKSNFHIVTGNTMNLLNIHDSVERAGLITKGVVLEPIASALAVLDDADKDAGVALVDIGGGTTDIAIFHEGIIRHTSVLPLAGNAITFDIKEGCKILKNQAETLKTRFGSCLPQNVSENDIISIPGIRNQPAREISMRTLATIIKARTETILEQVDFEIKQSGLDKHLIAGIVLTGGGAQLRHIKELTEFITGIDTRIGLPDEHLEKDSDADLSNTMYATGIGLVLYGLEREERLRNKEHDDIEPDEKPADTTEKTQTQINDMPPVFDSMPPMPDEQAFSRYTEVEREEPIAPVESTKKKEPKSKERRRRGFGSGFTNAIESYFSRVFNDGTIKNEGEE